METREKNVNKSQNEIGVVKVKCYYFSNISKWIKSNQKHKFFDNNNGFQKTHNES